MDIKRCNHCILPDNFPGISFDANGVCNLCSTYEKPLLLGEDKLRNIFSDQHDAPYNCIVPLSGGKDSTFVLYYAVKRLGLKVIAVNYDSGFQSELSLKNVHTACQKLQVPLFIHKADFRRRKSILQEALNMANVTRVPFGVCVNCGDALHAIPFNTAKKYGVRIILSGSSRFESTGETELLNAKDILRKVGLTKFPNYFCHLTKFLYYMFNERRQLKIPSSIFKPYCNFENSDTIIRSIKLFDYISWDLVNQENLNILTKELGWQHPEDRVDRFDCAIHPLLNFKWYYQTGITLDGFLYSNMIRGGVMTRGKALNQELLLEEKLRHECYDFLKCFGFDEKKTDWLTQY